MADEDRSPDRDEHPPPQPRYFAGEKGRTVPRSAWWVLAVACVLLLLFFIFRPSWFTHPPDDDPLHVPADRHFTKTLAELGHTDGVRLDDDTPSTSFLVTLPVDSTARQTRLKLTGTTQVAEDSTVFLAVSMDGQEVFRNELPRGDHDLDEKVEVPSGAAADGRVRVRIETSGTLHTQQCASDHAAGMLIHLDPDTVLEAALDTRIHTVRDVVAAWGRELTLVVTDQSDPWRTAAAQLGIRLTRAGYHVTFSGPRPDTDAAGTVVIGPAERLGSAGWTGDPTGGPVVVGTVDDAPVLAIVAPDAAAISRFLTGPAVVTADGAATDPRTVPLAPPTGNQVGFGSLGADLAPARITDSHTWRINYSPTNLPGGRLPQAARLAFQLPASPDDLTWLLDIELNGRLLDSRRLAHTTEPIVVPLPPAGQALDNILTLTVQRDRDLGGCDVRLTSYPIQLLDSSGLDLGEAQGGGLTDIPRELAPGFDVYLPDAGTGDVTGLLTAVVPLLTEFVAPQFDPMFRWNVTPPPDRPFVLIGQSPQVGTPARIQDGRLLAGPGAPVTDLSAFAQGTLVQCATAGAGARGVAITPIGTTTPPLPAFGNECTHVLTAGGDFVLDAAGAPVSTAGAGGPR